MKKSIKERLILQHFDANFFVFFLFELISVTTIRNDLGSSLKMFFKVFYWRLVYFYVC